ncbi:hypothetical protein HYY75_07450 [bacterium]|nr:hypothetical protein [bacterium]
MNSLPGNVEKTLIETVKRWPDQGQGFADIAFALFPEEGFFPLSADMWLNYDERLSSKNAGFKGPVFYREPLISPNQAQNDVEMYEKLHRLISTNSSFSALLQENGIDVSQKRRDFLTGLYVLAVEAFLKGNFSETIGFLNRIEAEFRELPENQFSEWKVMTANLQALCAWSKGNKKDAETLLRDAFYKNRKLPQQRYILRNLGLLTLDIGDQAMAREMFRLGLELKPSYSLLREEFSRLKD